MKHNQIATLLNSTAEQSLGIKNPIGNKLVLTDLISLGTTVIDGGQNSKESFFGTLINRVGKDEVDMISYDSPFAREMIKDSFTYGAYLQSIYVEMPEAEDSEIWNITDGQTVPQWTVKKPKIKAQIFSSSNVWQFKYTLPDDSTLMESFSSWENMAAFISGIAIAQQNAAKVAIENLSVLTMANFIGEKAQYAQPISGESEADYEYNPHASNQYVNVLHLYNTETNKTLTIESAKNDAEFWRWFSKKISIDREQMRTMTQLFNTKQYNRFTSYDNMKLCMINYADAALQKDLYSTTFHDEWVKIGGYYTVPYFQGIGDGSFDETTTVNITTSSGNDITVKNVIAVMYDEKAMGAMFSGEDVKDSVGFDPNTLTTTYFFRRNRGMFNNLTQNGIVYYMAEV